MGGAWLERSELRSASPPEKAGSDGSPNHPEKGQDKPVETQPERYSPGPRLRRERPPVLRLELLPHIGRNGDLRFEALIPIVDLYAQGRVEAASVIAGRAACDQNSSCSRKGEPGR